MNDPFTIRVRAAAVAGWWTVLVAAGFVVLLWLTFLWTTSTRPAWILSLWGPDMTWPEIRHVFLWVIAVFRLLVWLLVLLVLWLTFWARRLRKRLATS